MFEAAAFLALLGTATIADEGSIHCNFPNNAERIHVILKPTPSLRDKPDRVALRLTVDDRTVSARAEPITETPARDIMIRTTGKSRLAMGLREDGTAALNIRPKDTQPRTLLGDCVGDLDYLIRWLRYVD